MAQRPSGPISPQPPSGDAAAAVRSFALGLPGALERDHHGIPSFRVSDRIFATLPEPGLLRVFLGEQAIQAAVAEYPDACRPVYWGRKLTGVGMDLGRAPTELVQEYLTEAWAARAARQPRAAGLERS